MSLPSPAPSYAAVLRAPHACRTFGAALLGRLSYGISPLSLVLAVKETGGSYAAAGTVMALLGLTGVLLSPARAALVDRYGPRRVLPPLAVGYALALAGLALMTSRPDAPEVPLGALALVAGAVVPPLGPVMRTLWSELVPDRLLLRAYSLDTVAEELLFVTGPLLVGLLVEVTVPSAGLAVSAVLVLTGTLALVSSPAARGGGAAAGRARAVPAAPSGGLLSRMRGAAARRSPLRGGPGLRRAVAVSAATGMCLGALDLLVIAFADAHHAPGVVPWALAALSAGSAIGGLAHGAVPWRLPNGTRLSLLAAALGLVLATAGLSPHPYALVAWAWAGGLFVAPALTTAYLVADESAAPAARTRAGAWVNTAFNAGSTGATAAAGFLVGRLPLPVCFVLAAAPAVLSAAAFPFRSRGSVGTLAASPRRSTPEKGSPGRAGAPGAERAPAGG